MVPALPCVYHPLASLYNPDYEFDYRSPCCLLFQFKGPGSTSCLEIEYHRSLPHFMSLHTFPDSIYPHNNDTGQGWYRTSVTVPPPTASYYKLDSFTAGRIEAIRGAEAGSARWGNSLNNPWKLKCGYSSVPRATSYQRDSYEIIIVKGSS